MSKSPPIPLNLAVEDVLSEAILRRIILDAETSYAIGLCFMRSGKSYLQGKANNFNNAAKGTPFLLLTDLDNDPCAPQLVATCLTQPKHPNLIFRVAIKEVETWLLADQVNFAKYFGVTASSIPTNPERIQNPKEFIVTLARKSRFRRIREDLVPTQASGAAFGRNYNQCLIRFVEGCWDSLSAARQADSLNRTINVLNSFRPTWNAAAPSTD